VWTGAWHSFSSAYSWLYVTPTASSATNPTGKPPSRSHTGSWSFGQLSFSATPSSRSPSLKILLPPARLRMKRRTLCVMTPTFKLSRLPRQKAARRRPLYAAQLGDWRLPILLAKWVWRLASHWNPTSYEARGTDAETSTSCCLSRHLDGHSR